MIISPTTISKPLAGFCNGKRTSNYPDPNRCDGYIACVHGTPIFMVCSAYLHYNPTLDQCDWKYHVKCPYRQCFFIREQHFLFSHYAWTIIVIYQIIPHLSLKLNFKQSPTFLISSIFTENFKPVTIFTIFTMFLTFSS